MTKAQEFKTKTVDGIEWSLSDAREFLYRILFLKNPGIESLKSFKESEIANLLGLSVIDLRKRISSARRVVRYWEERIAKDLKEIGYSESEIGNALGLKVSTVRLLILDEK